MAAIVNVMNVVIQNAAVDYQMGSVRTYLPLLRLITLEHIRQRVILSMFLVAPLRLGLLPSISWVTRRIIQRLVRRNLCSLFNVEVAIVRRTKTADTHQRVVVLMENTVFVKPTSQGPCGNPECSCGLPDGFCENIPASFEIDYVRAYQAKSDSKHVLGCSTKARPTAKYIMGHKKDYTEAGQKEPLQPIQRGGGYCTKNKDCGHPSKGSCSDGKYCICEANFTGPMCLSHAAFDDNPPQVEDLEVDMLRLSPGGSAMFAFAAVAFIVFVGMVVFKKRRMVDGYDQLPSNGNGTVRVMQQQQKQQVGNTSQGYQQTGAYNPMGASTDAQKTVTYCMIDNRLLDDQ